MVWGMKERTLRIKQLSDYDRWVITERLEEDERERAERDRAAYRSGEGWLDKFVDFMFGFVWVLIVLAWIFMWTT
jgi:hypothetical protein